MNCPWLQKQLSLNLKSTLCCKGIIRHDNTVYVHLWNAHMHAHTHTLTQISAEHKIHTFLYEANKILQKAENATPATIVHNSSKAKQHLPSVEQCFLQHSAFHEYTTVPSCLSHWTAVTHWALPPAEICCNSSQISQSYGFSALLSCHIVYQVYLHLLWIFSIVLLYKIAKWTLYIHIIDINCCCSI